MSTGQIAWQDHAEPKRAASVVSQRREIKVPSEIKQAAYHEEVLRCVLVQVTLWGALINRDSIDFARGIAEMLVWSAEHARTDALRQTSACVQECPDWACRSCGERVPGNFALCWNCEMVRGQDGVPIATAQPG